MRPMDRPHRRPGSAPDPLAGRGAVPPSTVRAHLAALLSSRQLSGAPRLCSLLRFIVEETLQGRGDALKEARIGLEVFGRRPDSYDPAIDPIVRVQMGRLRAKLRSCYEHDSANEPVRIDVPTGGYTPSFSHRVDQPAPVEPPSAPNDALEDPRIAVLPIVNMSADSNNQYFCDGLTDELINHLAQIPGLRVVARTSSFQFKDAARDVREVGRLLDVGSVLEGSVRKAGNRVRVTMQLINAADGYHIWSERYDAEVSDIFAIHDRIARAVERALEAQLSNRSRRPSPRVQPQPLDAYNHYLQGRFLWKKRTEQGLRAALEHFERAVTIEPAFARAFSGIADCHLMLGMSAAEAPERSMPRAGDAARQALQLDASLAEAHTSLGAVKNCYEWDLAAAEREYEHALTLDPTYATTFHWLGLFLCAATGRLERAIQCLQQGIDLDPLSVPILADLGLTYAFRGEPDAAIMYCRRALELDPYSHRPYWFLGLTAAWNGDFPEAEAALTRGLELCPGAAFRTRLLGALGFTYGRWTKTDQALDVMRELERTKGASYVPSFELAQVAIGAGNIAAALTYLEDAVLKRESFGIFLAVWPSFRSLVSEPRYRPLLGRIGMES